MKVLMLKCSSRWDEGYGVVGIYSTLDSAEIGMLDHSAKYSFYSTLSSWSVDDGKTVYVYVDEEDAQEHELELVNDPNFKPDWLDTVRYQIVRVEVIE
jgi:hypothetical protein